MDQDLVSGVTGRLLNEGMAIDIDEQDNRYQIPGFRETTNFKPHYAMDNTQEKKKGTIAKFFSNLSRLGMSYDEDVVANMRALPADKNFIPKQEQFMQQDLFSIMSSPWKVKSNADKNFYEKDFPIKREVLRKLALQPELEDILDTMSNECIVYDSDLVYFAEPFIETQEINQFTKEVQDRINNTMSTYFRKFYKMLNWKYNAWDDFKRFLIEGNLAWEIVYDSLSKPTKIIGLVPLDVATLTRKFENNKWYWIQFKGIQGRERKLLDSQIIYIAYQDTKSISRVSYLERLIRPFNIYRIIEQAQIVWTVTNSSYKTKYTVPVRGMNRTNGLQTLASEMNRYKEDIKFIGESGELTINGQTNLPFNKDYWFPDGDAGTPDMQVLGGDGPDLNDNDQLKFFKNQLYKISKIPLNRFDQESGESWFGTDATNAARTEIDFGRFVTRLRNVFSQIMIKPLQLQLALDIPELQDNREVLEAVSLAYKSYNLFEELMNLQLMKERVQTIQELKDGLIDYDAQGNEVKYFSSQFLVEKYLKLSDQDLKLNDKLKQEEIKKLHLAGGENSDQAAFEKLDNDDKRLVLEVIQQVKDNKKIKKKKEKPKSDEDEVKKEEEE